MILFVYPSDIIIIGISLEAIRPRSDVINRKQVSLGVIVQQRALK